MATKSVTLSNGRTVYSDVARPFALVIHGRAHVRHFGSVDAARRMAVVLGGAGSIFFDYSPGCGHFVERIGQ